MQYFDIFGNHLAKLGLTKFDDRVKFTKDYFPQIPQTLTNENISIRLVNRFVPGGLKDFAIADISKTDSIGIALWILGCYFQRNHSTYLLDLVNAETTIKQVCISFEKSYPDKQAERVEVSIDRFIWKAQNVEEFVAETELYFNQKVSLRATNLADDVFTMEHFNSRDVLVGFGGIGGAWLAAEFFLNIGLEVSNVNYEHLSHDFYRRLTDHDSCDFRAEVYHQSSDGSDTELIN